MNCPKCGSICNQEEGSNTRICSVCGNIDQTLEVQNGKIDLEDLFGKIDRLIRRNIDGKIGS